MKSSRTLLCWKRAADPSGRMCSQGIAGVRRRSLTSWAASTERGEIASLRRLGPSHNFVLGFFLVSTVAQAERLPIKAYTTADGLPHNTVMRIVRD